MSVVAQVVVCRLRARKGAGCGFDEVVLRLEL